LDCNTSIQNNSGLASGLRSGAGLI